jgi:hypothetical protein
VSKVLTISTDQIGMRTRLSPLIFLLATSGFGAFPALADEAWTTATHVGFGVEDGSTTGYEKVAGSLFFLDLGRGVTDDLEVGLRTIGQGGKRGDRQFTRLGAGPLLTWNINDSWRLQTSVAVFDETGLGEDGEEEYRSRGHSQMLGWERRFALGQKVELGYGGFLTRYQGNLKQSATSAAAESPALAASLNRGYGHGLAASLKIQLD